LVIDKNGKLLIDGSVYIPSIYGPEAEVRLAYIKRRRKLISYFINKDNYESEKLIIRESCIVSGEWIRRTNYFTRNENGEWMLDYFNGISKYNFVLIENNPWSKYRESKD